MKRVAPFIAIGIMMSFAMPAHAATDTVADPSAESAAAISAGSDRSRETLHGTVALVDERHDRITIQLASSATAELRVRDGLLFNAVRYGDEVEIVVEDIGGTKTIVGLTKQ
jgi:Cu/Ag efflux protein CusF